MVFHGLCETGRLTPPAGLSVVRQQVARYLTERDSEPADWRDVFLSSGATDGIRSMLALLNCPAEDAKPPGVLIPVPQYPLFSSTVAEFGMYQISYHLDEGKDWAVDMAELQRALENARPHCEPRVLVVINPGNPGGFVLSRKDIEDIIKLAHRENLFILADEVYQYNVYSEELEFVSFKKVLRSLDQPWASEVALASFMSGSKGYMGECGARSGFCEVINIDDETRGILTHLLASRVCPSTLGQVCALLSDCFPSFGVAHGTLRLLHIAMLYYRVEQVITFCITYHPQPDEPSHARFCQERASILRGLGQRADLCYDKLNSTYIFSISSSSVDLSFLCGQERGLTPDELYTLEMLETCGVCVLPGYLFGQRENTFHFRLTFLPQEPQLRIILERIVQFHGSFMEKYKD
ncbi:GPT2 [Cordylochernes scorpioides]|uniref:alanine transaminase n=1 Tax=Cordylochernes scorpioides TaxID=51811 RepID=A0ABY6LPG2_9ARAC|nr:GPT2 [Cordylochernes scorpioides]